MTPDRRPPHVIVADEAADRGRAADQRQRVPTVVTDDGPRYYCPRYPSHCPCEGRGVCSWSGSDTPRPPTAPDCPSCGEPVLDRRGGDIVTRERARAVAFDPDSLERATILRRRSPVEARDHHLSAIRAHLIGLGLTGDAASKLTEEIERLTVEVGP